MPVNYTVKATVVDVRQDTPKAGDRFYVDTNAWFWTAYSKLRLLPPSSNKKEKPEYPAYLKQVLNMGGQLHWCGLSLSELAHLIEGTEFEIYQHSHPTSLLTKTKEYRHNLANERANVVSEIKLAWSQIETMANSIAVAEINAASTTAALQNFEQLPVDGYDLFSINAFKAAGITQVISDDGDFCCVPGITLFTANQTVIAAAHNQKKIRRR
jgi:hypothetical protein